MHFDFVLFSVGNSLRFQVLELKSTSGYHRNNQTLMQLDTWKETVDIHVVPLVGDRPILRKGKRSHAIGHYA